jgi:hypothetical protein
VEDDGYPSDGEAIIRQAEMDATHIYWTDGYDLKRVKKDGTEQITLFTPPFFLEQFLLDGDYIYALRVAQGDQGLVKDVVRMNKDGSALEAVPTFFELPALIDDTYAYYVSPYDACGFRIDRVAKAAVLPDGGAEPAL